MRILLAHSFYRLSGGEDNYVQQQAELLARSHVVELVSERNEDLPEAASTAGRMLYSRKKKTEILRLLRRFRPDVVHVHNVYPSLGPAVHLACREAGVPLVMTVHNYRLRCPNGLMFTEGDVCRRCQHGNYFNAMAHACFPSRRQATVYAGVLWIHRFVGDLEERVSMFLCPSDFVRRELLDWGVPSTRAVSIPNFVRPRQNADTTPGRFGVFVGRLSAEKGVHILLEALRIANDPPFRVVGDGPMSSLLQRMGANLGLKNIQFLGRVSPAHVDDIVRGARFVVLPSLSNENCPMAALEAMALGRPILVTSRGGLPDLVRGGAGLLSRAGDPADLALGIERLIRDDKLCSAAGQRGLNASRQEFGPEAHLSRLESAYRTVLRLTDRRGASGVCNAADKEQPGATD